MTYIIFFFKQKTAYEMRISDWSSDVCSSDLAAPRNIQQRADLADAGVPAVGGEKPELRIELFDVGCVIPARGDDDRRVAKLERLVQLKVGVACNPALDEVGGRGFDDVDPRQSVSGEVLKGKGSARGGRSEEHTSELQSLMRNSDAVFCL